MIENFAKIGTISSRKILKRIEFYPRLTVGSNDSKITCRISPLSLTTVDSKTETWDRCWALYIEMPLKFFPEILRNQFFQVHFEYKDKKCRPSHFYPLNPFKSARSVGSLLKSGQNLH